MKCKNCGHENEDGLKYCTNCGKPLEVVNQDVLVDLAYAYIGIPDVAKEIVNQSEATIEDIRQNSIRWIQEHNSDLFQDEIEESDSPLFETITDISQDLKDLDYEERIVVLMHCVEKLSLVQISEILGISMNQVKYYLQQSYQKTHPEKNQEIPKNPKQNIKRKPKKKESVIQPKFLSHITWKTQVIIALVLAIVLGGFFGVKKYASNEYKSGVELYEKEEYEQAAESFLNAKRYGGSKDAGLMLAKTYYSMNEYDKALNELEECDLLEDETKEYLILTYTQLANEQIEQQNYGEAIKYLEKQYEIDQDELTNIRIQACKNNGIYETDTAEYNAYGNPVKVYAIDGNTRLYQVDFEYDENQKISSMQEYVKEGTKKTVFNSFENVEETNITWSYQNGKLGYYEVEMNSLNEDGNVLVSKICTPGKTEKISYTYTYDADNQITEVLVKEEETSKDTYSYNGQLLTDIDHGDGSVTKFKYNRKNQLTSKQEISEDGSITSETNYTYQDEQLVSKQVDDLTYTYTYTNDQPYTCTIERDNQEVGRGYYVRQQGWIILYIE